MPSKFPQRRDIFQDDEVGGGSSIIYDCRVNGAKEDLGLMMEGVCGEVW